MALPFILCILLVPTWGYIQRGNDLLDQDHIRQHLKAFERIAHAHGNSRAVNLGHRDSGDYIFNVLQRANACDTLETQWFISPVWTELRPPLLTLTSPYEIAFQHKVDFQSMRYGGNTTQLPNVPVIPVPSGGCQQREYSTEVQGMVVLLQETKSCSFWDAAYAAQNRGAVGVLFYNRSTRKQLLSSRVRLDDWKANDPLMTIPVLAVSYSVGQLLTSAPNVRINLNIAAQTTVESTFNVLCEWKGGDPDDTVVAGAHLDSVAAGPGINDNGSGSATLLEIVLTLRQQGFQPGHRLLFAWWGAEEDGLLGSKHFVRTLRAANEDSFVEDILENAVRPSWPIRTPITWDQIALYLNFDMLASPNYVSLVYRAADAPPGALVGATFIQQKFEEFFRTRGYTYELTDMLTGSDFIPFMKNGVPTGGLATGAGKIKTNEQRRLHGGLANAAFDTCYHQACDTLDNINWEALYRMSEAAAHVIKTLAE
ncbi:hypothetical protein IWQ61_008552 [Dispira simplex]|nr:hypothetical protein IWQ61_008552 [Dispira simplex]